MPKKKRKTNKSYTFLFGFQLIECKILPSRMAFIKSSRLSSLVGRIFFGCDNFCGVINLPPAMPFKSPLAIGLYVFDGLSIGGGGGGGGGTTDLGDVCL